MYGCVSELILKKANQFSFYLSLYNIKDMKYSEVGIVIKEYYDYSIIGGGISGLYLAYRLLKRGLNKRVIVLEKEDQFGGRIMTGFIKGNRGSMVPISAGAGRFSKDHVLFMKLIREFGLGSLMVKLPDTCLYHHIDKRSGQVVILSEERMQLLIESVVRGSRGLSKRELIGMSFVGLASRFLSKEDVQYILDSFGYYSELVIMNAYSCLQLMGELNSEFYALKGGYMVIIDELVSRIRKMGGVVMNRAFVSGVSLNEHGFYMIEYHGTNHRSIVSQKCIFAIPTGALMKFPILRPVWSVVKSSILCAPLCRIFATYPVGINGSVWFKGMSRITVNNRIRMIIPISEADGVIMISYSDHHFADFWKSLYDREGKRGLKKEIRSGVSEAVGYLIPDAIAIEIYYWNCGVGYWKVGSDSLKVSRSLVQPIPKLDVYICNENIAVSGQQWMEGSLEMANSVLQKI
jgi:Flavin containing amine oxidoreductase